ncbi:trans-sialidase [Trypanosoma cruzi]|nr:trans-sialidase [Trypanosoma cruzi]
MQCNIMSLSSLFLVISAMHHCCAVFVCASPHTLCLFYSFTSCSCRDTHTTTKNADCSGFGCFFCSVCWRLRVAAASFRGHEGKEGGEGAHTASQFCCWRDAPPATYLSWALNPSVGVMAGNFVAASWLGEDPLPRVALWTIACSVCVVLAAGLWPYPVVRGTELETVAVCRFSSPIGG